MWVLCGGGGGGRKEGREVVDLGLRRASCRRPVGPIPHSEEAVDRVLTFVLDVDPVNLGNDRKETAGGGGDARVHINKKNYFNQAPKKAPSPIFF